MGMLCKRRRRIYELDDAYVAKGRSAGVGSRNERRRFVGDGEVAPNGHAESSGNPSADARTAGVGKGGFSNLGQKPRDGGSRNRHPIAISTPYPLSENRQDDFNENRNDYRAERNCGDADRPFEESEHFDKNLFHSVNLGG